jgi:hypothetical protein
MISKENFSYIDHNFKLLKNKTIQNTYVIILSSNNNIDITKILTYDLIIDQSLSNRMKNAI